MWHHWLGVEFWTLRQSQAQADRVTDHADLRCGLMNCYCLNRFRPYTVSSTFERIEAELCGAYAYCIETVVYSAAEAFLLLRTYTHCACCGLWYIRCKDCSYARWCEIFYPLLRNHSFIHSFIQSLIKTGDEWSLLGAIGIHLTLA